MDGLHIALIILLILCLELNRRFYNNYIADPPYNVQFYPTTQYKTGDLILFRALDSKHLILTNTFFSHVGIVIMQGYTPYILELTPPNVKFSPLRERLDQYFSGSVFVKPLHKPLTMQQQSQIPKILMWAERLSYPNDHVSNYMRNCDSSIFWTANDVQDFECAKFIIYILRDLGLLYGNENVGCNGINFLSELNILPNNNSYDNIVMLATINNDKLKKIDKIGYRKL